ncbi:MAG: ATP-binding protein [Treponema sp.]|jgi:anti-sigma regulatory factor (Ser/Thr protein kinase)|nr:ATP-binding protein [Treponema sp.]
MDRRQTPEGPSAFERETTLPATLDDLDRLLEWVKAALDAYACPAGTSQQLMMVTEEIFVNIANYAYPEKTGDVTVRIGRAGEAFAIQFEDGGEFFDPLDWPNPKIKGSIEERKVGGLGIYLVKTMTDHADYRWLDGRNQLTIFKTPD